MFEARRINHFAVNDEELYSHDSEVRLPWQGAYESYADTTMLQKTFDEPGTYEFQAVGENGSVGWTVVVESDGMSGPSVRDTDHERHIPISPDGDTLQITVEDDDTDLNRIIWLSFPTDQVEDVNHLSGNEAVAAGSYDSVTVTDGSLTAWVINDHGVVTEEQLFFGPPSFFDGEFTSYQDGYRDGYERGYECGLAHVEGEGTDPSVCPEPTEEAPAVSEPETGTPDSFFDGFRDGYEHGYGCVTEPETGWPDSDPFCSAIPDATPLVDVEVVDAADPVVGGEWLAVHAAVTNTGDAAVSVDVELVVGESGDVVDTVTVEVAPNESTAVELGYETYEVEQDVAFPIEVRTSDATDQTTVKVHGVDTDDEPGEEGDVTVSIDSTNAPVEGGSWLEVVVSCGTPGSGEATDEVQLVVADPNEVVDTETVTVPPEGTEVISLGYETYPVETDVEFPVEVRSSTDTDRVVVQVHGTG